MPRRKAKQDSDIDVAGPRVLLRPVTDEDIAAVERWYGEAAAAVHGVPEEPEGIQSLYYQLEAARADPDGGLLVIARRNDPAPTGLLDYRANSPASSAAGESAAGGGWLTVGFIAVARQQRGWGYGSEAVRLLEREASRRWRASRFRAGIDARNGLGLYFWLRLGYRPAAPSDIFWPSQPGGDIIWMVRTRENP